MEISFPKLGGLSLTIEKALPFTVFGIEIAWYGVIIGAGIALAILYAWTHAERFDVKRDHLPEFLVIAIPACYLGARLYYVIYQWEYYAKNPMEILNFKHGGMAIYGAVLVGALVVILYVRLRGGAELLHGLDLGAICLLIGQVIGRWGNFMNGEAYGYETSLPWGMSIDGAAPVHPTFFYESMWNLILLVALHLRAKKAEFRGEIVLWYICGYGLGRSWIEGLRQDSLYWWGTDLRVSQVLALVSAAAAFGALIYIYTTKRYPKAIGKRQQKQK